MPEILCDSLTTVQNNHFWTIAFFAQEAALNIQLKMANIWLKTFKLYKKNRMKAQ